MKKIIVIMSVLLAIAINVRAQIIDSLKGDSDLTETVTVPKKHGIAFGPEFGLNLPDMALQSGGQTISTSIKPGLALGGIVDYGITNHFYLQPGLFYLMNGCNISTGYFYYPGYQNSYSPISYFLNTFQLPVNLLFKFGKPGRFRLFFGIGPYIAYNISGALAISTIASIKGIANESTALTIGGGSKPYDIKPWDYGAGINAGYQFDMGLLVRIHYQVGFANLTAVPNSTYTTSALGLTVGYLFGGKSCR
jgi:hypothetical protein